MIMYSHYSSHSGPMNGGLHNTVDTDIHVRVSRAGAARMHGADTPDQCG